MCVVEFTDLSLWCVWGVDWMLPVIYKINRNSMCTNIHNVQMYIMGHVSFLKALMVNAYCLNLESPGKWSPGQPRKSYLDYSKWDGETSWRQCSSRPGCWTRHTKEGGWVVTRFRFCLSLLLLRVPAALLPCRDELYLEPWETMNLSPLCCFGRGILS